MCQIFHWKTCKKSKNLFYFLQIFFIFWVGHAISHGPYSGLARVMLQFICDTVLLVHLRYAASVSLKNFVRTNWSCDGEAPLADDERDQLRNMLIETMFQQVYLAYFRTYMLNKNVIKDFWVAKK